MARTTYSRNKGDLPDILAKFAEEYGGTSIVAIDGITRRQYDSCRFAVKRLNLPVDIHKSGELLAIGETRLVNSLSKGEIQEIAGLQQKKRAYGELFRLLSSWDEYDGVGELQALPPESYSRARKLIAQPWRGEEDCPSGRLPEESPMRVYGASVENIQQRFPERLCHYRPSDEELADMVVPGA